VESSWSCAERGCDEPVEARLATSVQAHEADDQNRFVVAAATHTQQIISAKSLVRAGKLEKAKRELRNVLDVDPLSFEAVFAMASVHDIAHEHEACAELLQRAIELDPNHAHACLLMGDTDARVGDFDLALASYTRACQLDPNGPVGEHASGVAALLRLDLAGSLKESSCWGEAASFVCAQRSDAERFARDFQHVVRIWDDVLAPNLVERLIESVDDLCTWSLRNPRQCTSFWLPRDTQPETAAEVAGRALLTHVLGHRVNDFAGIEWWCVSQAAKVGNHLRYDTSLTNRGLSKPMYASVLYLSDEGGPTIVLDQVSGWPAMPHEGHVVMPRTNRFVVFSGELRHGTIPAVSNGKHDDRRQYRRAIVFNFWSFATPAPPSCQVPDFTNYRPVCETCVAGRHCLNKYELSSLLRAEGQPRGLAVPRRVGVVVDELDEASGMEWSCELGGLRLPLPMPSPARLCTGLGRAAAALRLNWRLAAERWLLSSLRSP